MLIGRLCNKMLRVFPSSGRLLGAIFISSFYSCCCLVTSVAINAYSLPPPRSYFASCIPGLESVLAKEIAAIGGHGIEIGRSGVSFTEAPPKNGATDVDSLTGTSKDTAVGLKCLLWARTCHKIMELVATTQNSQSETATTHAKYRNLEVYDKNDLYEFIQRSCDVKSLLGDGKGGMLSFAVKVIIGADANSKNIPKELCHTHFTALTVKNALVDKCRYERSDGERPNVNTENPDVPLLVALRATSSGGAHVSVYRSLNGFDSLHKRGYRTDGETAIHKAAMKESMASGLLYECGWDLLVAQAKKDGLPAVLVDPMTGSGTFCIEAALMAADIAPGLIRMRKAAVKASTTDKMEDKTMLPAALRWKSGDITLWRHLCEEARVRREKGLLWVLGRNPITGHRNCEIFGNELHKSAYKLALLGRQQAGLPESAIEFHQGDCQEWKIAEHIVAGRTIVVANPPWGLRLDTEMEGSWVALKKFLREECVGAEAWVLSGNKDATRTLNMKKTRSVPLRTAAENLRWLQYPIFKASAISTNNNTEITQQTFSYAGSFQY